MLAVIRSKKSIKNDKKKLEELSKTIRKNIFELLELWSSQEEQIEYQKNIPIAQVSTELFCEWDDFYHPETEVNKLSFSEIESEMIENLCEIKIDK